MTSTGYQEIFGELFGFVANHPTFEEAHRASEHPRSFRRGMADFWRYKERIGAAFADVSRYVEFQHDMLFHFCTARQFGKDVEALAAARERAPQWLDRLLALGDSPVGYRPGTIPPDQCTVFHTRHCSQLAFLMHHLHALGEPGQLRFVEIGGGFGNYPRLLGNAAGFGSWTICDMPFMTDLQRWYLRHTLPSVTQVEGPTSGKGPTLRWVDTEHLNEFADEQPVIDVLISTHAWSELPRDQWLWYLRNLLPRARCLLYAASNETPDPIETNWRLQRLSSELRLVDCFHTHGRSSVTALFVPHAR